MVIVHLFAKEKLLDTTPRGRLGRQTKIMTDETDERFIRGCEHFEAIFMSCGGGLLKCLCTLKKRLHYASFQVIQLSQRVAL